MSEIKSIDTHYDGHKFRSRQEARWAVFFNSLDITYRYEPEGFELPNGERYLPDFYLPDITFRSVENSGLWVEVKGRLKDGDDRNSGVFETVKTFVDAKQEPLALLVGRITNHHDDWNIYEVAWRKELGAGIDAPMVWVKCEDCGGVKIEFPESGYMTCENCGGSMIGYGINNKHPDIQFAIEKANKARFEHGESP